MQTLLETFFMNLHQGVVLVSTDAVVRFMNPAAAPLLSIKTGETIRNTTLTAALEAARHGLISLPHTLELPACAGLCRDPLQVQLLWSPLGQQLALLLCSAREQQHTLTAARAMGELINQHGRTPMQNFFHAAELALEGLKSRPAEPGQLQRVERMVERAIAHGKAAVDKLSQLVAIAQAAEGRPLSMDERVSVCDRLQHARNQADDFAQSKRMRVFVEGAAPQSPVIYGDKTWLERAVHELIVCGLYCGSTGSDVLVTSSDAHNEVRIAVRVAGNSASLPLRDRAFTPFYSASEDEGLYARSLGIGVSFARWVIERHGGTMDILDDDHGIAEFACTLPCGLPTAQRAFDPLTQAQRYAEDLARVLGSAPTSNPPTRGIFHEHTDHPHR